MPTTRFIREEKGYVDVATPCHDGVGPWKMKNIIGSVAGNEKLFIKFIHDDVIPPGSTFGYHAHKADMPFEEWYFCLAGHGIMTLDGKDHEMGPGDISVCYANGSHGIRNTGREDMRIIVVCASPVAAVPQ